MLKNKNKSACKLCELDEITKERIKDMARFLEHSETDIIKFLVSQYYKQQVIKHEDADGYLSMEFIPLFETQESYQQFKDEYFKEYGSEYPAVIINKENYNDYTLPQL
jgi:hypothetical protein